LRVARYACTIREQRIVIITGRTGAFDQAEQAVGETAGKGTLVVKGSVVLHALVALFFRETRQTVGNVADEAGAYTV
jgi:hypothetical protein